MKELSIEEKAKRYDKAIKLAKDSFNYPDYPGFIRADVVFPELKESEDEKIRKEMISFFSGFYDNVNVKAVDVAPWIAWLEKQGKKDEEIILLKDKIESLESARIAMQEVHRLELEKLEKQGEQKPAEWSEDDEKLINSVIELIDNGALDRDEKDYFIGKLESLKNRAQPQQKQEWSEDDEENLNWFEKFFRAESVIAEGKDIPQDRYLWFKNLKYRVQPKQEWSEYDEEFLLELSQCCDLNKTQVQWLLSLKYRVQPRQEWSYNDEIIIETIIQEIEKIPSEKFIDNAKYRCLDWLRYRTKSLRPQSQWKPSDKQIEAVRIAAEIGTANDSWAMGILKSMYLELKKLRE